MAKPVPPKPDFLSEMKKTVSDLEKQQPKAAQPAKAAPAQVAQAQPPAAPASSSQASNNPNVQLSASEQVAFGNIVKHAVQPCWNAPVGALDAKSLVPEFRLTMNPDGTVRDAQLVNTGQLGNPNFRAAAESARRAVLNPQCSKFPLPADRYSGGWDVITIKFDPKDFAL